MNILNKLTELKNKWVASWRPYPLVLLGYNIVRWENHIYEYYYNRFKNKLLFMCSFPDKAPCHIQYLEKWGFLLEWPLCFHIWYQIKLQEEGKPGTEKTLYLRIGFTRWDLDGYQCGWKIGKLNTLFGTLYFGLHWD